MRLPRLHGVELEDLPGCPGWLRDEATAVLALGNRWSGWPRAVAERWRNWLDPRAEVLDCCSGAAGPWKQLLEQLPRLRVTFTDRFPNPAAWERLRRQFPDRVSFREEPLDARELGAEPPGVRSFFNSFHHFRPAEARRIVAAAVEAGQPLAVFEIVDRRPLRLLLVLAMPLLAWLTAWVRRPWSWRRLLFTYALPLIPLILCWDGWVSCFRVYTESDWRELIAHGDPESLYDWEFGRVPLGWLPVDSPYVLGRPRRFVAGSAEA